MVEFVHHYIVEVVRREGFDIIFLPYGLDGSKEVIQLLRLLASHIEGTEGPISQHCAVAVKALPQYLLPMGYKEKSIPLSLPLLAPPFVVEG